MPGAAFGVLGILLIAVILLIGLSPIFIVPVVVLVGAAIFTGLGAAAGRAVAGDVGEPPGVTSTEDAAYEPTRETAERTL
jgi:phosphotransferase system  glucose/maltose/N-acetylglucosamine-specific IIC component